MNKHIRSLFIATFAAIPLSALAGHSGPNYGGLPSGVQLDHGSRTFDNARGGYRVMWTDRFGKQHVVTVGPTEQVTVVFPIPYGGSWYWFQDAEPRKQRTGFNPTATWVEAVFIREGNYVRIQATGHRSEPADPGLWGEVQDRIKEVGEVAAVGAKTAAEAKRIAGAAGLLKH